MAGHRTSPWDGSKLVLHRSQNPQSARGLCWLLSTAAEIGIQHLVLLPWVHLLLAASKLGFVCSNEDFLVGFGAWGWQSSSVLPPEHVWWPPAGARLWGCTGRTRGMCPRMFLISSAFSSDYGARELCDCWPCHLCHLSLQAGLLRVLRAGWKPGSFGLCAQTNPGLFYNVSACR